MGMMPSVPRLGPGESPRGVHYAAAARTALSEAIVCRDARLRVGSPWERRIDRALMREYAHQWRDYTRRAQSAAA